MFGFFKKKEEPKPASDPVAEQMAQLAKLQSQIAGLQSQIGALKGKRAAVESRRTALVEQRLQLKAALAAASSVPEKNGIARQILSLDKQVAQFDGTLALIDKSIQDHNATIGTIINIDVAKTDVGNVVDLDTLTTQVREESEKASERDLKGRILDDANAAFVGTASSSEDDAAIAAILAEDAPTASAAPSAVPAAAPAPAAPEKNVASAGLF